MPRAIDMPTRETIVQRHQQGESLPAIARALALPFASVRKIWRRFRDLGEAGLAPSYDRCGPHAPHAPPLIVRAACGLKRRHPDWGAGLIRVLLQQKWPERSVPHERTLQRWFQKAGVNQPPVRLPPQNRDRAQRPHEVWQIDAKEKVLLGDGSRASWLGVVDEATGARLATAPFPPGSLGERGRA